MTSWLDHKKLHATFKISLFLKGLFELAQIASGVLVLLANPHVVFGVVHALTREELSEDPRDFVARHLLQAAHRFSISGRHFAGVYLLSHGIIKLWLIAGLWRGKPGYYPVAIVVFAAFTAYQLYRYSFTQSVLLLGVTVLDLLMMWLTWMEYRYLRARM